MSLRCTTPNPLPFLSVCRNLGTKVFSFVQIAVIASLIKCARWRKNMNLKDCLQIGFRNISETKSRTVVICNQTFRQLLATQEIFKIRLIDELSELEVSWNDVITGFHFNPSSKFVQKININYLSQQVYIVVDVFWIFYCLYHSAPNLVKPKFGNTTKILKGHTKLISSLLMTQLDIISRWNMQHKMLEVNLTKFNF